MLKRQFLFLALAMFLVVAGCSEQGKADAPVAEPQAGPAPVEAEEPTLDAEAPEIEANEPAETMPSMGDLLPQRLGILTEPALGDLDAMAERRVIRVLVIPGGPQFFFYQGKPRGMITELLAMLQQELNASLGRRLDQVEIVPMPVSRDRLIPALLSGRADLVAADLTITEARSALVDFSEPFATGIDEIVVFAPQAGGDVQSIDALSGRDVFVRKSSSYFEHRLHFLVALLRTGVIEWDLKILNFEILLRQCAVVANVDDVFEAVNTYAIGAL